MVSYTWQATWRCAVLVGAIFDLHPRCWKVDPHAVHFLAYCARSPNNCKAGQPVKATARATSITTQQSLNIDIDVKDRMFKKFGKEEISGFTQVKASVARGIRSSIGEQYPFLSESGVLDVLIPKKEPLYVAKTSSHMQVAFLNETPLFYSDRDGHWFPTLRILHQYPDMMPKLRTDKGAIKFVLSGANIMCPGLTSAGATIHDEVDAGTPVAIYAEDKQHAMAVGLTTLSTKEMREVNKGIGVELMHNLNDALWKTTKLQ